MAGMLTAGAVWFGAGGANAGSGDLSGWPGRAVASMAEAQRLAAARADDSTLIVVTRQVRDAFVDLGREGPSPGDFVLFEEKVFNSNGTERIGRDAVRCEFGLRTFTCEGTIKINGRGKLRIAGTVFANNDNVFPVTGGTREFRGYGGTLKVYGARQETILVFDLVKP